MEHGNQQVAAVPAPPKRTSENTLVGRAERLPGASVLHELQWERMGEQSQTNKRMARNGKPVRGGDVPQQGRSKKQSSSSSLLSELRSAALARELCVALFAYAAPYSLFLIPVVAVVGSGTS